MSLKNRRNEYKRLMASDKEVPKVLKDEFDPVKPPKKK